MSMAVAVMDGSFIPGGNSDVPGIGGAALFMLLIVSMLNCHGLGAGVRLIPTGVIVFAIVAAAGRRRAA